MSSPVYFLWTYDAPVLGIAGTATSPTIDAIDADALTIAYASDVAGTYYVEFSIDGVNWDSSLAYTFTPGSTVAPHVLQIARRYVRVRIVNGSSAQSWVRCQLMDGIKSPVTSKLDSVIERQADSIVARVIDSEIGISNGLFAGYSIVNKFGVNFDVDEAEDVWTAGGLYTGFPTSGAETLQVFSSSAEDGAGTLTGALTLRLEYLDSTGAATTEDVTLTGTTPVTTSGTATRCARAYVLTAGSAGSNVGTITVRWSSTTSVVFATIGADEGQTQVAAYTIPAGSTGYIRFARIEISREAAGTFDREAYCTLMIRWPGGAWRVIYSVTATSAYDFARTFYGGIEVPALTDIKWRVRSVTNANTRVTAGFGVLLRNS